MGVSLEYNIINFLLASFTLFSAALLNCSASLSAIFCIFFWLPSNCFRKLQGPEFHSRYTEILCYNLPALHSTPVSYTHLRAHETRHDLVCRLLLETKK